MRERDRERQRGTERDRDRETDRQTDRQTETETETKTETETEGLEGGRGGGGVCEHEKHCVLQLSTRKLRPTTLKFIFLEVQKMCVRLSLCRYRSGGK